MYQNEQLISEQRLIKKESTRWALTTVIANAAISVMSVGMGLFLPVKVLAFLGGPVGTLVNQILLTAIMFTAPFAMSASLSGQRPFGLLKIRLPRFSTAAPLVMLGLGGAMVINLLVSQMISFLDIFDLAPTSPELPIPDGLWGTAFYIFTLSAVPAIVEEFAFRGMVMGSLRRFGDGFAILASSLLFGLMHGNFVQIPFATALGCLMGYVAIKSNSIWSAVAVHFLNNLMASVQSVVMARCSETVAAVVSCAMFVGYLVLGLIGLIIICKRNSNPFAPMEKQTPLITLPAFKASCSSAGYIVAFIYFGGTACLYLLMTKIGAI